MTRKPQVKIFILFLLFFPLLISSGKSAGSKTLDVYPHYTSYLNIPGVTPEETAAIEQFRTEDRIFIYGVSDASEYFNDRDRMGGFAVLFSQWLTELFGLKFVPTIYSLEDLFLGVEAGKIDFTGELNPSQERGRPYFMTSSITERTIVHDRMIMEEMLPLVYNPVALATRRAELNPIISVVQKYLDLGGLYHLVKLHNQGYRDYLTYRFHDSLNEEEYAYVTDHDGSRGPVKPIPLSMEKANYPVAFYNGTEKKWEGIAWDVLKEAEAITGLSFQPVNDKDASWAENLALLESGEASILSELIITEERQDRFLWSRDPISRNSYALLSKLELEDLGINEVLYTRVALVSGSAYTEIFRQWFPGHPHVREYPGVTEALEALKDGEVDLFMGTRNTLLTLTNYMEEPGFKTNIVFSRTADSHFGFNRDKAVLCSVMDKAIGLINTDLIETRWLSRVFDYRNKLVRFRQPYLIGSLILLGVIVFLLIALAHKYKETGIHLRTMVQRRTRELEERTRELEIQKEAVQTAYRVKSRFLANMSHEIRTPLNAIIGLSELELEKSSSSPSIENLSSINRSGASLLSIINDLLDVSSIESGEMTLQSQEYSTADLIGSMAALTRLRIGEKQVDFRLLPDQGLPSRLWGDERRVKQILRNLISNAVKFTKTGSIILRISCDKPDGRKTEAFGSNDEIKLILEVQDSGIGIKEEDLKKLFTDYNQVDTTSSRSAEGTGMGLLITKKLAEMMGGNIYAVSEYGSGSVFTVIIRQKVIDPNVIGKKIADELKSFTYKPGRDLKELRAAKPWLPYGRVLLVDDVPTNLAVARGIMKPCGMTIDTAGSGREAVELIRSGTVYDAIFMDHMMPEMDGVEALRIIREEIGTDYAKSVPVIALTANAMPESREAFLASGFNAFLSKPIRLNELYQVLRDYVRDEEKEKELLLKGIEEDHEGKDEQRILEKQEIPGVDLMAGAAQFGNETSYLEIIKVFIADTPKLLDSIRSFPAAASAPGGPDKEYLRNYTITVHGIKGSCYGICAQELGDQAKELEFAAKAGDLERISKKNGAFISAAETLIKRLKALFPKEEKPKTAKAEPDGEMLDKLLTAAKIYNINDMLSILSELDQYSYQSSGELMEPLREAVNNYEYGEVVSLLEQRPRL